MALPITQLFAFPPSGEASNHDTQLVISDLVSKINANFGATVASGTTNRLAYYTSATAIGSLTAITASRALASDSNGLPVASATTAAELAFVNGVTSAIQTQLNAKASTALSNLASVAINTTLVSDTDNTDDLGTSSIAWKDIFLKGALKSGATTLATITELGYLTGVTSAIQTQFSGKASTALSNLASVAINTALLPASDLSTDIGSSSKRFANGYFGSNVDITTSLSGSDVRAVISNTSNTASSTARVETSVAGSTASDAYYQSFISGGVAWSWGLDNSDGDSWTLSRNSTLGTNNAIRSDGTTGAVAIRGTTTNDSASTGFVGEIVSSFQSATNLPTTAEYGDLTSISLTAGDWDVTAHGTANANSGTWTSARLGISIHSGNDGTDLVQGDTFAVGLWASSSTTPLNVAITIPMVRMSLTSTTTVYLKYRGAYSAGTPTMNGRITARRIR